jgi:hypothetical protein
MALAAKPSTPSSLRLGSTRSWSPARRSAPSDEQTMVEETVDLANGLRQTFKHRDELYAYIDQILFQELEVEIPQAYKKTALQVRAPLASHMANTVAAALTVNPLTIQFRPIAFGDVAQQNATVREHFFEASWARQEQEANRQLLRLFMYALATKGAAVLKTVERTNTAWAQYATQAKALEEQLAYDREYDQDAKDRLYHAETEQMKLTLPFPIATTDVPPETFYFNRNENGFTACVEIKQVPYSEALDRFGTGMSPDGTVYRPQDWVDLDPRAMGLARHQYRETMDGTNKMLTVIEAWDYQVCSIVCVGPGQSSSSSSKLGNGTLVKSFKHGYGDAVLKTLRGPYFQALGITTNSRAPAREGLGVLSGFLDLFPLLDSLLTIEGNAAMMTGFPAFKRTSTPGTVPNIPPTGMPFGSDGRERQAEEIRLGDIYPYDVAPIDQPKSGVSLTEMLQNVQTLVQLALPSVVQGVMASDQASGYALNQAAYLARLAWDPIVKNAQQTLGMRCGFESWLIEHHIGEDVYAWAEEAPKKAGANRRYANQQKAGWISVGPDDLNGVHRYEAHLDISTPSDDVVKTRAIAEKLQLQLMTWEDAAREMGGNPDEIEHSNLLRMMKQSPAIMNQLQQLTLQKLGSIQAEHMQNTPGPGPAEMMSAVQGGGAGGPPGPNMGGMQIPGQPPSGPSPGGMPANPVPTPGQGMGAGVGVASPVPVRVGPGAGPGGVSGAPVVPQMPMQRPPIPGA